LFYKEKILNINDQMVTRDITHGLKSVVTFDSKINERTGYWTSYLTGADRPNTETGVIDARSDLLTIEITD